MNPNKLTMSIIICLSLMPAMGGADSSKPEKISGDALLIHKSKTFTNFKVDVGAGSEAAARKLLNAVPMNMPESSNGDVVKLVSDTLDK